MSLLQKMASGVAVVAVLAASTLLLFYVLLASLIRGFLTPLS